MEHQARILADSLSPDGARLVTFELTYPRIIHAEMMTHRVFSRNAASSRAIPVEKMIRLVNENPYIPSSWGKNQKGMQAGEDLPQEAAEQATQEWLKARDLAVGQAQKLLDLGLHKQLTNRLLEPFQWYTALFTGSEWDNFFHLRCHKDAHPDIRMLAEKMRDEFTSSTPKALDYNEWHMPLIFDDDYDDAILENPTNPLAVQEKLCKISVGRCARVSYLTHDGKRDHSKDIELYDRLFVGGHMCFDDETEALTSRGWVRGLDLRPEDEVFSVDIRSGRGGWEVPSFLPRYTVDQELYHVMGQQVDLKVTFNHKMVVSSRKHGGGWTPFRLQPAEELWGRPVRYLKAASYTYTTTDDDEETYIHFPGLAELISKDEEDVWGLLGFFVGDGYAASDDRIEFHLKKPRKARYLESLGFSDLRQKGSKYTLEREGLGAWFRAHCYDNSGVKVLPLGVLKLSHHEAQSVLGGLRNSDGSVKRKTWCYYSTSRQVVDTLQALLHINGRTGGVSCGLTPDGEPYYKVNVSDRVRPRVEISQKGRARTYSECKTPYKGEVWCVTVSTGAFLVRRNGKVVVSGNSPFEHIARPAPEGKEAEFFGNFKGWVQYRKTIPHEDDLLGARTAE